MQKQLLWQKLEETLQRQVSAFGGVAGIAIQDLGADLTLSIHGDEIFPTASSIKIHILVQLLARAEVGAIDLQQRIPIDPAIYMGGSGVLAYLTGPVELTLLDLAILMIIASDNTATNLCIDYAGLEATNQLIQQLGLTQTKLRRKMMDHLAAVREEENVSTPNEMVTLMELLYNGKPSPAVAEQALEILKKPKRDFLDRALPIGTRFANKPGYVERACCDVGLVYLTHHPYAIAMMTKYGLCSTAEQEQFIVDVARTVHETMTALEVSNQYGRAVYGS